MSIYNNFDSPESKLRQKVIGSASGDQQVYNQVARDLELSYIGEQSRQHQFQQWSNVEYLEDLEKRAKSDYAARAIESGVDTFQDFSQILSRDLNAVGFINNDRLRESAFKQAAIKDFGGILGESKRSVAAKFAGVREISSNFQGPLKEMADEVMDALQVATGSDGSYYTYGSERDGTTIGNLGRQGWSMLTGGDEMRGFAPGTALYEVVMQDDPEWTEDRRKSFVDAIFNSSNEEMLGQIGVTREGLMATNSMGSAMAGIIDRQANHEAGQYFSTASTTDYAGFFVSNLGRVMLADPDTAAEFGIALGAAAFTGGTSLVGFGARQLGRGAWRVSRAASKSKGLRQMYQATKFGGRVRDGKQFDEIILKSGDVLHKWGSKTATGLGKVSKAGTLAANLNPFAAMENIIFPAIRDVRMVRRFIGQGKPRTRRDLDIHRQIQKMGVQGVAGRLMKDVFISTAPISFKAGLAANMLDGALGNMGAYAFSRDDEYQWAKHLYGDEVTWQQYRGSLLGTEQQGGILNSYVGSAMMGAGFGMVIGGAMRGLAVARFKAEELNAPDAGDAPPIAKNPLQSLRKKFKDYDNYANGKSDNTYLGAMISGERTKVVEMAEEQLMRGFISSAARNAEGSADTPTMKARAKMIAQKAFDSGLDMQNFVRRVTREDGTIDMKEAISYVRKHGMDLESRKRLKAREIHRRSSKSRETEAALHQFNVSRLEKILEADGDWEKADHAAILDEIIESSAEGSTMREVLENYREALKFESDNVVSAVMVALIGFGEGKNIFSTRQKQQIINQILVANGLRDLDGNGVSIDIASLEKSAASKDRGEVKRRKNAELREKKQKRVDELKKRIEDAKAKAEAAEAGEGASTKVTPEEAAAYKRDLEETRTNIERDTAELEELGKADPDKTSLTLLDDEGKEVSKSAFKIREDNGDLLGKRIAEISDQTPGAPSERGIELAAEMRADADKGEFMSAAADRGLTEEEVLDVMSAFRQEDEAKLSLKELRAKAKAEGLNVKAVTADKLRAKMEAKRNENADAAKMFTPDFRSKRAARKKKMEELENRITDNQNRADRLEPMVEAGDKGGTPGRDTSEDWAEAQAELEEAEADLSTTKEVREEITGDEAADTALREAIETEIGGVIISERMRGSSEASTLSMEAAATEIGGAAAERARASVDADAGADQIVMSHLVNLDDSLEWDARTNQVNYSLKEMARRTRRNMKAIEAALPSGSLKDRARFTNRAIGSRARTEMESSFKQAADQRKAAAGGNRTPSNPDRVQAILDDFGVDLNVDAGGRVISAGRQLNKKELEDLYMDLSKIKQLDELSEGVRAHLMKKLKDDPEADFDPVVLLAMGDHKASVKAIGRHLAAIDRVREKGKIDAKGYARIDDIIAEWPEGEINLIHSAYLAPTRGASVQVEGSPEMLHLDTMALEAENRLMRVGSEYRRAYGEGKARREDGLTPSQRDFFQDMNIFENRVAQANEFLAKRADGAARLKPLHERIIEKRRIAHAGENGIPEARRAYDKRQKQDFARGVYDAWVNAPVEMKERIDGKLKEMGLTGFTRRAENWKKEDGSEAFDEAVMIEFGERMWDGMTSKLGRERYIELGDIDGQWNGDRNSASGYQVGQGLVEVLLNRQDQDKNLMPDLMEIPESGFKGRLRQDNYVRLYKQFYGEDVKRTVRRMGSVEDEHGNKLMTIAEIDDSLAYYDNMAQRIKALGPMDPLPKDIKDAISKVHYGVDKISLAPREVLKDIMGRLRTVRQVYKERLDMVENMPPSVMGTLHDEFKFMRDAHASVFGLGYIPGVETGLNPKVSGDAGFSGAAFTPGSAMAFVTLRTGQMFGSTRGLSDAAGFYGMAELSKVIDAHEGDVSKVLSDLEEFDNALNDPTRKDAVEGESFENSRDASAQATTLGQAIARDFAAKHGEEALSKMKRNTDEWSTVLNDVNTMLKEMGGGDEMETRFSRALESPEFKKYIENVQDENLYDNYTAAGVAALDRLGEDSPWAQLISRGMLQRVEVETPEGIDPSRVSPKLGGNPLSDWARTDLFKPPVMTVVYAVGKRGVRGQMENAIDVLLEGDLLDDAGKAFVKANRSKMTADLSFAMIGNKDVRGAIAEELDLPSSKDLVRMMQTDDLVIRDKTMTSEELLEGTWRQRDDAEELANEMMLEAQKLLGHSDLGLGLWLMKLRRSSKKDTANAVRLMSRVVDKAKKDAAEAGHKGNKDQIMARVRQEWKPVSGFLKSVESSSRIAYTVDNEIMGNYMSIAGARSTDLSPDGANALAGVAHFTESHPGAGRNVQMEDTTTAARANEQEGLDKSVKTVGQRVRISQKDMEDQQNNIFGPMSDDKKVDSLRVKNAVVKDLMFEYGGYINPPSKDFKPKTLDDFQTAIYEYNAGPANSHRDRTKQALGLNRRIEALEKKNKEGDLTPDEMTELPRLHAASKTFFQASDPTPDRPDNIFNEQYGSGMFNSMYRAEAMVDVGIEERRVSHAGIEDLNHIDHTVNNREMQMIRQDQEWTDLPEDDKHMSAFSFEEVTQASPLAPEYINAARATRTHGDAAEDGVAPTEMANRLRKRNPYKSDEAIAMENGADKAAAKSNETSVGVVRLDRLNSRLARHSNNDADKALRHLGDRGQRAMIAARQSAKNRILQGWRNTFGQAPDATPDKANMYKLDRLGRVSRERGVAGSPYEALANFVQDNDSVNHMGVLAGPVHEAGFFLSRWDATKDRYMTLGEGPQSVAMAPLSVFARDYKIVGTAARDFAAVTALRIAQARGIPVKQVIDEMNAEGFFAVHKKFIESPADKGGYGNLRDMEDRIRFEEDGRQWMAAVDDGRLAELEADSEIRKTLANVNRQWLKELGGGEGAITNASWDTAAKNIEFIGVRDHLTANQSLFDRLKETAGQDFTVDEFARALSSNRADMASAVGKEGADAQGVSLVHVRTEGGETKRNTVDYVNGMDVVDHNITPGKKGEVPLFTEPQLIHMLNISANRQVVRNIMTAHMFGLEIDPKKELDNVLRDANDDFESGNAVHGFAKETTSRHDADRLHRVTDEEQLDIMKDYGQAVARALKIDTAPQDEAAHGLAKILRENGLIEEGSVITKEGLDVVKAFELGYSNVTDKIEAVQKAADSQSMSISDSWTSATKRKTAQKMAEDEARVRENGTTPPPDTDMGTGPDGPEYTGGTVTDTVAPEDMPPPREGMTILDIENESKTSPAEGPALHITMVEGFEGDEVGNAFLRMLEFRGRNGSQPAYNAAAIFSTLTGRDGSGNGMSGAEAMAAMEMSFVDKDFQNAFYGGHMVVEATGDLQVDFARHAKQRIQTRLRGLNHVKQAMRDKGISAASYMLTHELVERMDGFHALTSAARKSGGSSDQSNLKSRIGNLFVENFGTPEARGRMEAILRDIGVFDDRMQKFFDTAARFDGGVDKVADISGKAKKLNELSGERAQETNYEVRAMLTEGFTQVLTMALMMKKGRRGGDGVLAKHFHAEKELQALGEALSNKLNGLRRHVTRYGVTDRKADDAIVKAGHFIQSESHLDGIIDSMGTMARNLKHDKILRNETSDTFSRYWGGTGEEAAPISSRSLGDVRLEIGEIEARLATASSKSRIALQLRLNNLNEEFWHMTNDPRHKMSEERVEELWMDHSRDDGLIDARDLPEGEVHTYVNSQVDVLLMNMATKQSKGVGAAVNYVAGKFNSGQALAANNSEFDAIRGLWALANPESVNTLGNRNKNWLPDQMAIDALASDKRKMMSGMNYLEKRLKQLNGNDPDPERVAVRMRDVTAFFEEADDAKGKQILSDAGFSEKDYNVLKGTRDHLMDKESGFLVRLAKAMYETGQMGKRDYEIYKSKPTFPRAIRKDMVTPANTPEIRNLLHTSIQTHLGNTRANGFRTDVAEMMGLYMDPRADASQRMNEFNAMPRGIREMYVTIAMKMPLDKQPANFKDLSVAEKAFIGSEFHKKWMHTPAGDRPDMSFNDIEWKAAYETSIKTDTAMPHSQLGPETRQMKMFREVPRLRNKIGQDAYTPASLVDGLAHLEMLEMKQGTRLTPFKYAGKFDDIVVRQPDLGKYVDSNPQHTSIRLLSSNAPRAFAAMHQQHAIGVKGMSTLRVIDNLRQRIENGTPMEDLGVSAEQRGAFLQQLNTIEDAVRTGWDMAPRDNTIPTSGDRVVNGLARGSVGFVSGGNFAMSALAEAFATIPGTIGRMLMGDLKAPLDYIAALSPRAREEAMNSINGWETAKMQMGLRSRMGDMGLDTMDDLLGTDSAPTAVDKFENGSRTVQRVSMLGMRTFTEYSRTVSTRQAIRKSIAAANRGSFNRFGTAAKELSTEPTLKEVRAAARKAGLDPTLAVSLHQSGMADPDLMLDVQGVMGNPRYFDKDGLKVDNFYRDIGDERLKSVVTHILQFQNNKVNLDTRIGNKQIPKNVVESLIGALGQYPMLFYSRMRQGAWQGGAMMGSMAIILPLALGEIYYHTLSETARTGNTDALDRWKKDPAGAMASVIAKMNLTGGFTPIQAWGTAQIVQTLRQGMDNPEFMSGFNSQTFGMSPINSAGLGMFVSGMRKMGSASADIMQGEFSSGFQKAKDLGPFSYKQLWKGAINGLMNEKEGLGGKMAADQGRDQRVPLPPMRSSRPPQAQMPGTTPKQPKPSTGAPTSFQDKLSQGPGKVSLEDVFKQ